LSRTLWINLSNNDFDEKSSLAVGDSPCLNHSASLIPDVLERGSDVDLLAALRHPVEDHVDQDVSAGATNPIANERIKRF
jgi:hypothetical protein